MQETFLMHFFSFNNTLLYFQQLAQCLVHIRHNVFAESWVKEWVNKHPQSWGRTLCDTKVESRTASIGRLKVSQTSSASSLLRVCKGQQRGTAGHPAERHKSAPLTTPSAGEAVEHKEFSFVASGNANGCNHFVRQFGSYLLLGTYPKE